MSGFHAYMEKQLQPIEGMLYDSFQKRKKKNIYDENLLSVGLYAWL